MQNFLKSQVVNNEPLLENAARPSLTGSYVLSKTKHWQKKSKRVNCLWTPIHPSFCLITASIIRGNQGSFMSYSMVAHDTCANHWMNSCYRDQISSTRFVVFFVGFAKNLLPLYVTSSRCFCSFEWRPVIKISLGFCGVKMALWTASHAHTAWQDSCLVQCRFLAVQILHLGRLQRREKPTLGWKCRIS